MLALPTKAMMDHCEPELPDVPVEARWELPPMRVGDTWSAVFTVPGEAAGYYQVALNAYTHGRDGGP